MREFELGKIVMTRGINEAISESATFSRFVVDSLIRYVTNDWGELPPEDAKMNDRAVKNNDDRIFSRYNNKQYGDIYIITEYDRSATTILFTHEY